MSPVKETFSTPFADMRTNLLDFDLEPMATPRSIPSITPRELETLRSELSSQISSLSATLSGKEAEVLALKRAITDAEVRVGNTSEELRNEKSLRENLEEEKKDWDRRGREMEAVLREIRQEIMIGEHEREKLRKQAEEAEKRTEEMEVRVVELQTRLESANRRTTLSPTSSPTKKAEDSSSSETTNPATPLPNGTDTDIDVNEAVRLATERVARDLHTLYKSKHETKVSALKKSYEARWEKKVRQLECELKSAQTEIGNLKTERDATMTGPLSPSNALVQQGERNRELLDEQCRISASLLNEKDRIEAEKKMLSAHVEGLESEIGSLRHETDSLRDQLETERIEKGELVAQVDLFLALGEAEPVPQPPSSPPTPRAAARGGESQSRIRSVSSDSITPSTSTSTSTSAATAAAYASPYRQHQHQHQSPARPAAPGAGRAAKPRPISMLQPPGKFSGIPGPGGFRGGAGKGLPAKTGAGIMEGIAKMGRGGAGGY